PGPVLMLVGERDQQVSPVLDGEVLLATLQSRSNGAQRLAIIPAASHNLKRVEVPEDPGFEGPLANGVSDEIVTWLRQGLLPQNRNREGDERDARQGAAFPPLSEKEKPHRNHPPATTCSSREIC